jgi:death-on-curing family protein
MPNLFEIANVRIIMLDVDDVVRLHARIMSRMHHGNPGLLSLPKLEGALGRPMNMVAYGERNLLRLAVAYAIAVSQAHAFVDGNKRAAYGATLTFLELNAIAAHRFVWAEEPSLALARLIERYAMLPAEREATEAALVALLAATLGLPAEG